MNAYMKKRLYKLGAVEVSLVPRGAIRKKFLVTKSDAKEGAMPKDISELLKKVAGQTITNEADIDKVMKEMKLSPNAEEAVKGALRLLGAVKDELPEEAKAELMPKLAAWAGLPGGNAEAEEVETPPPADATMKMEPVKKADGTWDFSHIDEKVRGTIEKLWTQNAELVAKAEAATLEAVKKQEETEKVLKAERDDASKKEFVAKSDGLKLAGKSEDFAMVLKDISEKAPESFAKLELTLKASAEAIAKGGLFTEIGSGGGGATGSAWERIEKGAASLVQKSEGKVTKEQAMAAFLKTDEGKKLYVEHEAANISQGGNK